MELSAELPVTLVIKAPNQRVGDQTVDCLLGWTVKKLKQHLTAVYPSQPQENHQKLIYSGKLLADHLTLKEVLRQFEDGTTRHTVHLVCSLAHESTSTQNIKNPTEETEGLHHRGPACQNNRNPSSSSSSSTASSSSPSSSTQPSPSPENHNNFYNMFNGQPGGGGQMPDMGQYPGDFGQFSASMMGGMGITPEVAMMYTPEQQMWLQQAYSQYMAQYMQYYLQAGYATPPNTPITPLGQDEAANQNADRNGQDNEARINAGGVAADDDDEFGQRDWLDYVYTLCRFMVLMGIVYFYSSFTRFIMVFCFFFFVYICQMGWFRLPAAHRRQQQANQEGNQAGQEAQAGENNVEQAEQPPAGDQAAQTDSTDGATPQTPTPEPRGPGAIQVAWTFICTFFTSLFPQPPEAVNVN